VLGHGVQHKLDVGIHGSETALETSEMIMGRGRIQIEQRGKHQDVAPIPGVSKRVGNWGRLAGMGSGGRRRRLWRLTRRGQLAHSGFRFVHTCMSLLSVHFLSLDAAGSHAQTTRSLDTLVGPTLTSAPVRPNSNSFVFIGGTRANTLLSNYRYVRRDNGHKANNLYSALTRTKQRIDC